jgi:hypothetical protein
VLTFNFSPAARFVGNAASADGIFTLDGQRLRTLFVYFHQRLQNIAKQIIFKSLKTNFMLQFLLGEQSSIYKKSNTENYKHDFKKCT